MTRKEFLRHFARLAGPSAALAVQSAPDAARDESETSNTDDRGVDSFDDE